jgi:hypothetical protein
MRQTVARAECALPKKSVGCRASHCAGSLQHISCSDDIFRAGIPMNKDDQYARAGTNLGNNMLSLGYREIRAPRKDPRETVSQTVQRERETHHRLGDCAEYIYTTGLSPNIGRRATAWQDNRPHPQACSQPRRRQETRPDARGIKPESVEEPSSGREKPREAPLSLATFIKLHRR